MCLDRNYLRIAFSALLAYVGLAAGSGAGSLLCFLEGVGVTSSLSLVRGVLVAAGETYVLSVALLGAGSGNYLVDIAVTQSGNSLSVAVVAVVAGEGANAFLSAGRHLGYLADVFVAVLCRNIIVLKSIAAVLAGILGISAGGVARLEYLSGVLVSDGLKLIPVLVAAFSTSVYAVAGSYTGRLVNNLNQLIGVRYHFNVLGVSFAADIAYVYLLA